MLTITHTWCMRSSEEPEKTWNYRTTVVINDETDQSVVTNGKVDTASIVKCDSCERLRDCTRQVSCYKESNVFLTSCSAFKPKEQN